MTASSDLCTNLPLTCGHHLASLRLVIGDPPPISCIYGSPTSHPSHLIEFLHPKRKVWESSRDLSDVYLDILNQIATSSTTPEGKNTLLTGCGKGSIGVEISKGPISGGANLNVVVTPRYNRQMVEYYQNVFHLTGSRSALAVVPFNQASKQDVDALIDYIHGTLNPDLDYVIPFIGLPENGREVEGLDDKSELPSD